MKLIAWAIQTWLNLDDWLLVLTFRGIRWCVGWLSWRQRTMERVLIGVFALAHIASIVLMSRTWFFRLPGVVATMILTYGLREMHKKSDQQRALRLFDEAFAIPRFIAIFIVVGIRLPVIFLPPKMIVADLVALAAWSLFALIHYIVSLPANDEGQGKRRKLAVDKLKALFGTSWVPQPLGEGV